jgi:hypothetical protein
MSTLWNILQWILWVGAIIILITPPSFCHLRKKKGESNEPSQPQS